MKNSLILLMILMSVSCGKIEQVQDSIIGMATSNDLSMVEIRIGSLYRNNPATSPSGYDYLEYENTRYRLGTLSSEAQTAMAQLPAAQLTPIYFKGVFAKRSAISTGNSSTVFDVVDISALTKK